MSHFLLRNRDWFPNRCPDKWGPDKWGSTVIQYTVCPNIWQSCITVIVVRWYQTMLCQMQRQIMNHMTHHMTHHMSHHMTRHMTNHMTHHMTLHCPSGEPPGNLGMPSWPNSRPGACIIKYLKYTVKHFIFALSCISLLINL